MPLSAIAPANVHLRALAIWRSMLSGFVRAKFTAD
jgi:hypothetical protein